LWLLIHLLILAKILALILALVMAQQIRVLDRGCSRSLEKFL
jgi:hypothetical protein